MAKPRQLFAPLSLNAFDLLALSKVNGKGPLERQFRTEIPMLAGLVILETLNLHGILPNLFLKLHATSLAKKVSLLCRTLINILQPATLQEWVRILPRLNLTKKKNTISITEFTCPTAIPFP